MAVRPTLSVALSVFPSGQEAKAKTVLGRIVFPTGAGASGYRPRILVVFTVLPRAPKPEVRDGHVGNMAVFRPILHLGWLEVRNL
ncbi:hypothetical protein HYQ46_007386 [Verticillium longisporum]|nr:hypothetical protein HYQ46_007386 [Verticillium longisporum]